MKLGERRTLAAIMFTDMVGYSVLTQEERDGSMIFPAADPIAEQPWNNSRFAALAKKMGLHLRPQRRPTTPN